MSALVLFGAAFVPLGAFPSAACAAEGARAALVVDTGDAVQRYCVALPDDDVSGIDLIVLAGEQHGLSYRFGYGGDAVCMLAGVGTTGDDCFESYPDFWGFWRGDGSGGWSWSGTGAGSVPVQDGDVHGWAWGSGSDGSSHPRPPDTTFASVCPVASPAPKPKPERRRPAPKPAEEAGPPGPSAPVATSTQPRSRVAVADGEVEDRPSRRRGARTRPRDRGDRARPAGVTSAAEPVAPAPASTDSNEAGGPPAAGLAALGAASFVATGAWFVRRRRGGV